jgi:hypothetical protein
VSPLLTYDTVSAYIGTVEGIDIRHTPTTETNVKNDVQFAS